jgi:hypothetical protein
MATEGADQRYLLTREMDMWHGEAAHTQNKLDDLEQDSFEATVEQAWYDYCFRKHAELARELDKIENPEKYSTADVAHVSLNDLDRQTD